MLAVTVQAMSAPGKPTFPRQRAVKATSLMNKVRLLHRIPNLPLPLLPHFSGITIPLTPSHAHPPTPTVYPAPAYPCRVGGRNEKTAGNLFYLVCRFCSCCPRFFLPCWYDTVCSFPFVHLHLHPYNSFHMCIFTAPALADISNLNPPAPVVMDTTTNADDTFFSNKNNNPAIDALASLDASDVLTEIEDAEIPQLEVKMGQLAAAAASNPSSSEAVAAAERQLEAIEREAALIAEAQSSSSYANGSDSSSTSVSTGGLLNELSALKTVMRGIPTK